MVPRPVTPASASSRERLAVLGLTSEEVTEAVIAGELHRRRCTRNHPPSYAGFGAWAETICRLAELKKPDGWTRRDPSNLSLIVSSDQKIAIAVATGDHRTGREGNPEPTTKYAKGVMVESAVSENAAQLDLFDIGRKKKESFPALTWILLVTRDRDAIRCELSLPHRIDDSGYIYSWRERIVIDPIQVEPEQEREPLEQTGEIDIPIEPREE